MGMEKHGAKGGTGYVGGFLQLFDWHGKSRKKLSYNKGDLPEGSKQGKRSDDNLPTTRFCPEYDNGGISSVRGSSPVSCVSSSTEDEGNGTSRAPGVVARLMGLDSLPTCNAAEPYSTPFYDPRNFRDAHYQRKTSDIYQDYQSGFSDNQHNRDDCFHRRIEETRPQKVPHSPIERFQCETLPPKSAKYHSVAHHKLLSPIKSPGFISPKNAADIMEAAAKILESGYQAGLKGKPNIIGSSSNPTRVRGLRENSAASKRSSRISEAPKRPAESNAARLLKGQSLNKSWNGSEDTTNYRAASNAEDSLSIGSKTKGKSVSLAIQAKVNVQRRESLSSSGKNMSVLKEEDGCKLNWSLKNQPASSRNRQNKLSTTNSSSVLRQNNQKQNCPTNKDKPSKSLASNLQGRKVLPGDASTGLSKAYNRVSGTSRAGKKEGSGLPDLEKDVTSRMKNFPRKKRAVNGDLQSEKSLMVDTVLVDRDEKRVQPHVAISEYLNRVEDSKRKGMDVVSFTFTSPMVKSVALSQTSTPVEEKQNTNSICFVDSSEDNFATNYFHGTQKSKSATDPESKRLSSLGLNVIGGDALSILLEQKLRELTSGVEASSCVSSSETEKPSASAPILEDCTLASSTFDASPRDFGKKSVPWYQKDHFVNEFSSNYSSVNGQVLHKFQGAEEMECMSTNDVQKGLECQHPSPISVFEASFSNESCTSSESCESMNGNKVCSGISQNAVAAIYPKKIFSLEAEMELADSASSMCRSTIISDLVGLSMSGEMRTHGWELEYLKEILDESAFRFKDLSLNHSHDIISSDLFHRLENLGMKLREDGNNNCCELIRRELFDCVSEFMSIKCSQYTKGGYRRWVQGLVVVQNDGLALEVFKEVLQWRSMGDWMVDELVEKDMSSHHGCWLDFEPEAFEVGVEIDRDILSSLVDELVADML